MAVPTVPTRLHSFTSHSVTQPSQPHDGDKLDAEINQLIATDTAILAFARQAIADDGTVKLAAISAHLEDVTTGPAGPQGPAGNDGSDGADGADGLSYVPDEIGVTADRTQYNAEVAGFAFLDTEAGLLYWKLSNTVADWSAGVAFGQGPQGEQGVPGPQGLQGDQGDPGPQGIPGTNGMDGQDGATGTPGMVARGTWDVGTAYVVGDIVTKDGTAVFVAIQASTGRDPATEPLFWTQILDNTALLAAPTVAKQTGATGALLLPAGTTAQRPAGNPGAGVVWKRRNTETGENEANYGAGWEDEGGGGAWIDHGLTGLTSGATREWVGLPPGILRFEIVTESFAQIPSQRLILTLGDSGGYETSGYGSTASRLSDGLILENFGAGFLFNGSQAASNLFARWRIERQSPDNNNWFMGMALFRYAEAPIGLYGRKVLSAELDRLRMSASSFFTGDFRVRYQLA